MGISVIMKVLILSLAFLALASATSLHSQFQSFEYKYGKSYKSSAERLSRFATFIKNVKEIEEHNRNGKSTYKKVINKFADMTKEEFNQVMNGYKNAPKPGQVFADVKDIGYCGSCWAFATAETIESYLQIASGNSVVEELSTQHITSCTPNELSCGGSGGCQGSIPQLGFVYTQLFGLTKEEDYPYTSGNLGITGNCKYKPSAYDTVATLRGYEVLPRNNLEAVMNHIANVGPLSVAVDASSWSFYGGGVFDGCDYNRNIEINHAVQLVGYGTESEGDFWLVRNSWGPNWGDNGYIKLKRESTVVCGTDDTPLMGTGCVDDGNDVLTVCGQCGILFDVCYPIGAGYIAE